MLLFNKAKRKQIKLNRVTLCKEVKKIENGTV